ncbi:hypothetical protein ABH926_000752 [Catenulispora sp. GP43]
MAPSARDGSGPAAFTLFGAWAVAPLLVRLLA